MTTDTTAWKTDDKAWMKERRAGWKDIKNTIDILTGVRGQDKRFLKSFYMTGEVDLDAMIKAFGRRWTDVEKPFLPMEAPVLYECWLTADQTDENWQHIKESYEERNPKAVRNACREFLGTMSYFPETGSMFSGLEKRLYYFLCPTRCRPEDFPALNRGQYIDKARGVYGRVKSPLVDFLRSETPNQHNFVRYRLPEWQDSIAPAFLKIPQVLLDNLYEVVTPMQTILNDPSAHADLAVDTAQQVEIILRSDTTPEPIQKKVDEIVGSLRQ